MCSNTSSSGGGGCGCGTGEIGSASIWSSGLKKQQQQKRARVPKRGPGVAELEKILREEEKKDRGSNNVPPEGLSTSCFIPHHSNPYNPPHPPLKFHPPPSPPPTMAVLNGNDGYNNNNTALGRNGGASGPGLVLPEQAFFPQNPPSSCKSNMEGVDNSHSNLSSESNPLWSYPALHQKRHNHFPPPMMNQFLGSGNPTSSSSLPIGLEPPSNQSSYYNYSSRAPEEQKMVGMKRPYTSLDNSLVPPTPSQVSPIFPHFSRLHQSSTNDSHSAASFLSSNDCYRDAKWGSPLELNGRKFNSDNGGSGHKNLPSFGTLTVPSPPIHVFQGELPKGNVLSCQVTEERMEDSYERSELSGSEHKPFYNFLEVKEQVGLKETTLGSNHEGSEAGSNGVDLTLKL